jgi:hypothetical protein
MRSIGEVERDWPAVNDFFARSHTAAKPARSGGVINSAMSSKHRGLPRATNYKDAAPFYLFRGPRPSAFGVLLESQGEGRDLGL